MEDLGEVSLFSSRDVELYGSTDRNGGCEPSLGIGEVNSPLGLRSKQSQSGGEGCVEVGDRRF